VLQECYKRVAKVLPPRVTDGELATLAIFVLQKCYKGVTRVLQGCYKGVTRVLPSPGVTRNVHGSLEELLIVLECYKGARVLQER
jgi:hypothetical protein